MAWVTNMRYGFIVTLTTFTMHYMQTVGSEPKPEGVINADPANSSKTTLLCGKYTFQLYLVSNVFGLIETYDKQIN